MYKVNLQDYKGSKIYFQLFDVLLKDIPIKKEDYLIPLFNRRWLVP